MVLLLPNISTVFVCSEPVVHNFHKICKTGGKKSPKNTNNVAVTPNPLKLTSKSTHNPSQFPTSFCANLAYVLHLYKCIESVSI